MTEARRLKLAMIGSRGVPCVYGGIERHVAEVGARLARRGHEVTVYGRRPFSEPGEHLGMRVEVLPAIHTKHLESATNVFAATLASIRRGYDVVHFHGIGPSLFAGMPAARGIATVCTVHALDYRQSKWGALSRALLRRGERTAVTRSRAAVAVSRLMAAELSARYGRSVRYIPNGTTLQDPPPFEEARRLGLEEGAYVLTVGRFIPERGFHTLLEAWRRVGEGRRLVIAGDAHFEETYGRSLRRLADESVIMPGYVSGPLLAALYAHCAFYVLPSTVEGLPISLIEALGFGRPALVSDIPENLEAGGPAVSTFRAGDVSALMAALRTMLAMGEEERRRRGWLGRERVAAEYTWDRVAGELEALYLEIAGMPSGRGGK